MPTELGSCAPAPSAKLLDSARPHGWTGEPMTGTAFSRRAAPDPSGGARNARWGVRAVAAAVISVVLLGGCGRSATFVDDIEDAARRAVANGRTLELAAATEFDWDRGHVFRPYAGAMVVNRGLGFRWKDEDFHGPHNDGTQLIVFVRDGRVVEDGEMPRCLPDFIGAKELETGIDRERAIFTLQPRDARCWLATPKVVALATPRLQGPNFP